MNNSIEKQKGLLIGLGIVMLLVAVGLLAGGIVMLVNGLQGAEKNILLIVFGILALVLFLPAIGFGIYCTWIGFATIATRGSIRQGNIAKEYGTANMQKCDRCGTQMQPGQTKCSECGKEY